MKDSRGATTEEGPAGVRRRGEGRGRGFRPRGVPEEVPDAAEVQSLATPARARFSSERAYFITWERSEWSISSASSLTCPGFSCRYQVPNVRLRSWGFMSAFLMPLLRTHP